MIGVPLPIPVIRTKKCHRCTKQYKKKLGQCPHCVDIPDGLALEELIEAHKNKLRGNAQLGWIFIAVSVVLMFLLLSVVKFLPLWQKKPGALA